MFCGQWHLDSVLLVSIYHHGFIFSRLYTTSYIFLSTYTELLAGIPKCHAFILLLTYAHNAFLFFKALVKITFSMNFTPIPKGCSSGLSLILKGPAQCFVLFWVQLKPTKDLFKEQWAGNKPLFLGKLFDLVTLFNRVLGRDNGRLSNTTISIHFHGMIFFIPITLCKTYFDPWYQRCLCKHELKLTLSASDMLGTMLGTLNALIYCGLTNDNWGW